MKKIIVMVVMLMFVEIFISTCSYAGDTIPTIPTRESVIELLEISDSYKIALQLMGQSMEAVKNGFNDSLPNNKKIPDEVWANLVNEAKYEMDQESFYDILIPIYSKYLTSNDIKGIIAFYRSDAGKKLTRVMPNIARDSGQAGQEWAKKSMHKIIPRMEKRLKEMGYSKEPIG